VRAFGFLAKPVFIPYRPKVLRPPLSAKTKENPMAGKFQVMVIDDDGMHGLWDDSLASVGNAQIFRASTVEPNERGKWIVQLSNAPENGEHANKYLSRDGGVTDKLENAMEYDKRSDALDAEVDFINEHILLKGVDRAKIASASAD
jgi:hypothetical protein